MPVGVHVAHALGMAAALDAAPAAVLDLGSGGGVPGLVLARMAWPQARWVLLESSTRRAAFLEAAISALLLADRVIVHCGRAEVAAHQPALRHGFDAVLARSFGPPGVTAECAAPFLRPGGLAVVSEPPTAGAQRWPSAGLGLLNLVVERRAATPVHVIVLRSVEPCAERYPRRVGVPTKRPLF